MSFTYLESRPHISLTYVCLTFLSLSKCFETKDAVRNKPQWRCQNRSLSGWAASAWELVFCRCCCCCCCWSTSTQLFLLFLSLHLVGEEINLLKIRCSRQQQQPARNNLNFHTHRCSQVLICPRAEQLILFCSPCSHNKRLTRQRFKIQLKRHKKCFPLILWVSLRLRLLPIHTLNMWVWTCIPVSLSLSPSHSHSLLINRYAARFWALTGKVRPYTSFLLTRFVYIGSTVTKWDWNQQHLEM